MYNEPPGGGNSYETWGHFWVHLHQTATASGDIHHLLASNLVAIAALLNQTIDYRTVLKMHNKRNTGDREI